MLEIINKILKTFDENNLWEEGIELIGSWCYILYQKHLGAKFYPLRTQDIDFLIPIPYKGKKHINLVRELEKLGFRHSFNPNGSIYLWNADLKIEFIAPKRSKGLERVVNINELSVKAIPLRFANILFIDPIYIKENNIKIFLPNPASFCLHKLIISTRRKKADKTLKDLEQAVHTFKIADKKKIAQLFLEFPVPWRKKIFTNLEKAKKILPLLEAEINEIIITLQELEKHN